MLNIIFLSITRPKPKWSSNRKTECVEDEKTYAQLSQSETCVKVRVSVWWSDHVFGDQRQCLIAETGWWHCQCTLSHIAFWELTLQSYRQDLCKMFHHMLAYFGAVTILAVAGNGGPHSELGPGLDHTSKLWTWDTEVKSEKTFRKV